MERALLPAQETPGPDVDLPGPRRLDRHDPDAPARDRAAIGLVDDLGQVPGPGTWDRRCLPLSGLPWHDLTEQ